MSDVDTLIHEIFKAQNERFPDNDPGDMMIYVQDDMPLVEVSQESWVRASDAPGVGFVHGGDVESALKAYLAYIRDGRLIRVEKPRPAPRTEKDPVAEGYLDGIEYERDRVLLYLESEAESLRLTGNPALAACIDTAREAIKAGEQTRFHPPRPAGRVFYIEG